MEAGNNTEARKQRAGGLFEGLSVPQVAAGALAAVTSLLLSSQIGWGGSVIGVAVGSVVSTVSSQVYKKFFQTGADKIRDLASGDAPMSGPTGTTAMPAAAPGAGQSDIGASADRGQSVADETRAHAAASEQAVVQQVRRVPGVAHPTESDEAIRQATAATSRSPETGTRVVSERLQRKARQRKRAKVQKGVIIVSVVSAVVAVGISAGIVSCATSGQGIGSKPASIVKMPVAAEDEANSSSEGTASDDEQEVDAATDSRTSESTASSSDKSEGAAGSTGAQAGPGNASRGESSKTTGSTGSGSGGTAGSSTATSTSSGSAATASSSGSSASDSAAAQSSAASSTSAEAQ